MTRDELELRYDGPIPAPFPPLDLERERQGALAAAERADEMAAECDQRAANWRRHDWPAQAEAWTQEANSHRRTAASLRESAARCAARLKDLMDKAATQRAAAE